jgi:hypothetical protein
MGLSRAAYRRMVETAGREGLPIVGHAPTRLGIDVLIEERQPLAHVGLLSNAYFLPVQSHLRSLVLAASALLMLSGVIAWSIACKAANRLGWRTAAARFTRARVLAGGVLLATIAAVLCPLFETDALRVMFTIGVTAIGIGAVLLVVDGVVRWRGAATGDRAEALALAISAIVLAVWGVTWAAISWRSSAAGIDRLGDRLASAGVAVQTTLVVYEAGTRAGASRLMRDPVIELLSPATQDVWRRMLVARGDQIPVNYLTSMQKVTKRLHARGVPIIAGTDAMGAPFLAPGASLVRELELLAASALTPYQALEAATVAGAKFLGRAHEFGTVAGGKRADLLLLGDNPLEDIAALRSVVGVVTRGRWFPRERLDELRERLVSAP